ncbi:hypothetical protein CAL7716_065440 [Calothrix sp. PCC 7716]|nr:hypothetical protein CAL7716_065440 [Calothrix sp. PCC 7716]
MFRKRFIITVGDSRVGKSTISRLLLELYNRHELNVRVYYHGQRPGDLSNKLSAYEQLGFNIKHLGFNRGDSDILLNELEMFSEIDLVLTDMPGQNLLDFFRFNSEVYFTDNLESLGYRPTFIHPISNRRDCVKYLQSLYDFFGNRVDYIVVKNQYFGEYFDFYDNSQVRENIESLKGVELILPHIGDNIYQDLEDTHLPYSLAVTSDSDIQLLYRSVAYNWMENFCDVIVKDSVIPLYLGLKRDRAELQPQELRF